MESLMQYIWCHRLWLQHDMVTTDGLPVQVLDPGRLNTDAGPDFFNAKVSIGGRVWAGNVEIHVRASDWHRHGHDSDPAYSNVILHVVDIDDCRIDGPSGNPLPQLVMPCSPDLNQEYASLVGSSARPELSCSGAIASIDPIYIRDWSVALAYERLHDKADRIDGYLARAGGDWDQAAFAALARSFGSGINGDMFERTALALPLKVVARHRDNPLMTDAVIFGQAQLLDDAPAGEYADALRREYAFLRTKFGLVAPQGILWKMARMRPANFPHRRLALLSRILQRSTRLMAQVAEVLMADKPRESLRRWLDSPLPDFWTTHYTFAESNTPAAPASLTESTLTSVLINAVIPLGYAYGTAHGLTDLTDRATDLMQTLPPESNSIVRMFMAAGIPCECAADSQAIIQLRRCYCEQHKCLYCRIGHRVLAAKARRSPAG